MQLPVHGERSPNVQSLYVFHMSVVDPSVVAAQPELPSGNQLQLRQTINGGYRSDFDPYPSISSFHNLLLVALYPHELSTSRYVGICVYMYEHMCMTHVFYIYVYSHVS